ncbi:aldo/keto reductase [Labedaea rhizosphaerae]|uniref:Aryl-alcohol dehydrogenase-like predicted oxidoreductase n=1 Tax=Labedaea rhizosphaerae TaxID=598644 RepID=A0A4R6S0P3_LABRH|nr:aldo/keto reductase [Labedaea rhizosphaerae]TDP92175.1 aryl-alcohol dehydrogenase-like predicted oxidoreductase [Labedaea rhizosphaerae]
MDRIGLGLAALGRPAYVNLGRDGALPEDRTVEAMRAACWDVLDAAYAAGVRWVDAARSYGRAEEFLSGWLAARDHGDVTISSKWGYAYVAGWRRDADVHEVKEHSLARFTRQWQESRDLLGDRISLYQVHSLTPDSPLFTDRPLQAKLAGLAAGGVRVGFSTSGAAQAEAVRRAFDLTVGGAPVFTAVQSTWNILEQSVGPALAEAHDAGALVLVKEAMANGRLAVQPPPQVTSLAHDHDVGTDAVALAAVLAQPWADVVLSGAASVEQLRANLRATRLRLAPDAFAGHAEPPRDYWAARSALAWT